MTAVPLSLILTPAPQSNYHSYCPIVWGNRESEMNCWMGDDKVPLPDLNTQDAQVQAVYGDWIANLVKEYSLDGLRIDGMYPHPNLSLVNPNLSFQLPNT